MYDRNLKFLTVMFHWLTFLCFVKIEQHVVVELTCMLNPLSSVIFLTFQNRQI